MNRYSTNSPTVFSMLESEAPGIAALKRHFQKTMKKFVPLIPKMKAAETSMEKVVSSLSNLLEQHRCVESDDVISCPLVNAMGLDLQARMAVKLAEEVHSTSDRLREGLDTLKEMEEVTSKARKDAVSLCRQYNLESASLAQGWPTVPPLGVMLTWLDSANRYLREQYLSRLHYLNSLDDKETCQNLESLWSEDMNLLLDVLQDIEEQTKYLLKEKL